jgi:leucyl-tRNA synthetase
MQGMGFSDDEIPAFANPVHWLNYFPPRGQADLQTFGVAVDWRRSFITTDVNPYYDAFIRWQFTLLHERQHVVYGTRLSIYSPKDGQPCADHDRASGEGVGPQEYTVILLRVAEPNMLPASAAALHGEQKVYLGAATLRPETMYGQTNCWIGPEIEYAAARLKDGSVLIATERALRNMAFQNLLDQPETGKYTILARMIGKELMGTALVAPLSSYPRIHVLPMPSVSATKGTGVVTSVPSDSPDDYINWMTLRENAGKRAHFGVNDEHIVPFDLVPIIDVPEVSNVLAKHVCDTLGVKNTGQVDLLAKAHDECYSVGYYKGVLAVGEFKGTLVSAAKPLIKKHLIDTNQAFVYSEPEKQVMSRSGDECVVALTDQWYLRYGEEQWKAPVKSHVQDKLECYSDTTKRAFLDTVDWLSEWACSRTYGLGTHMPFDENVVIDSLSDSTIYMAYYTIAHVLEKHVIPAEHCTREFFEYVFALSQQYNGPVARDLVESLRSEFLAFYPFDLRVSGKDLIGNHLTMCLYNHAAIWGERYMPKSFYCNGHVMVDNEKMSKSKGNFLTLQDAVSRYSADATRLALADAGDGLDDANFSLKTVDVAILRLAAQLEWMIETSQALRAGKMRTGPADERFVDRVFMNKLRKIAAEAKQAYERMLYRDALRASFYDLQSARDAYRVDCGGNDTDMHASLVQLWSKMQCLLLAPICPHWCDHIWQNVLGEQGSVHTHRWPEIGTADLVLDKIAAYLANVAHNARVAMQRREKKGGPKMNVVVVVVSRGYSDEQKLALSLMREAWNASTKTVDNAQVMERVKAHPQLKAHVKNIMPFVAARRADAEKLGNADILASETPFDEKVALEDNMDLLRSQLGENIKVVRVVYSDEPEGKERCKKQSVDPMEPHVEPLAMDI